MPEPETARAWVVQRYPEARCYRIQGEALEIHDDADAGRYVVDLERYCDLPAMPTERTPLMAWQAACRTLAEEEAKHG